MEVSGEITEQRGQALAGLRGIPTRKWGAIRCSICPRGRWQGKGGGEALREQPWDLRMTTSFSLWSEQLQKMAAVSQEADCHSA